jgi:N-acetyl-gamma-glutamyl-phosphate reductase
VGKLLMTHKIFIDGQAGTTGLRLADRLSSRDDIKLIQIDEALRKDVNVRLACMREADISFLCLPDDGAREIIREVESNSDFADVRIIDASTAHRTSDGWIYGMPELYNNSPKITAAKRVANPGCHATGYILALKPLISAGMLSENATIAVHSITGYSGGGKQMIATYEVNSDDEPRIQCGDGVGQITSEDNTVESLSPHLMRGPRQYGLTQSHKHLPEMVAYSGVMSAPTFSPIVADYYSGILLSVALPAVGSVESIHGVLENYYNGRALVKVRGLGYDPEDGFLAADALSGRDDLEIIVAGSDERVTVICRYDNLGKGASGAAIQNMNIMLGLPEETGLVLE